MLTPCLILSWKYPEKQDLSIRNPFLGWFHAFATTAQTPAVEGVCFHLRDAVVPRGLTVLSMEYKTECGIQVFQDANMSKIFRALFFSKEKCVIFIAHS